MMMMMMMMMMMTGSSNKLHVGRKSLRHGRNHPTGVGTRRTRISSNFGDYGDWGPSVVWSHSTFATGCNFFFVGQCGKLTVLPQTSLLNLGKNERRVGKGMGETWAV